MNLSKWYNAAMQYVIFTGGVLHSGGAVITALAHFDKSIAADAGASSALSLGITPDYLIGDFDSIDDKTLALFKDVEQVRFPEEKNETDTELAITFAIEQGATSITLLGGIAGDRIDHILANVLLLTQYTIPIVFVDANTTLWLAKGPAEEFIEGDIGDLLSLIPVSKTVEHIQTNGLQYALCDESLFLGKPRGISNVLNKQKASVSFTEGQLLITHIANS